MKNLEKLGKTLSKIEQKSILGGVGEPPGGGGGNGVCGCADGTTYYNVDCESDIECNFWCGMNQTWICVG
jgi:hypothetical protein